MNDNILHYFDEKDISFLRVPRFLRIITSPRAAEVYTLLQGKRKFLIADKKIRNEDAWFAYPTKFLQEDLLAPNSTNYLKGLLEQLTDIGLIETKVVEHPYTLKYYKLNDKRFLELAKQHSDDWKAKREKVYNEYIKNNPVEDPNDEDFDPSAGFK